MRDFGNRGGFGRREDRPTFDAVCSACQKACKVPFKPKADRAVFCQDCFRQRRAA